MIDKADPALTGLLDDPEFQDEDPGEPDHEDTDTDEDEEEVDMSGDADEIARTSRSAESRRSPRRGDQPDRGKTIDERNKELETELHSIEIEAGQLIDELASLEEQREVLEKRRAELYGEIENRDERRRARLRTLMVRQGVVDSGPSVQEAPAPEPEEPNATVVPIKLVEEEPPGETEAAEEVEVVEDERERTTRIPIPAVFTGRPALALAGIMLVAWLIGGIILANVFGTQQPAGCSGAFCLPEGFRGWRPTIIWLLSMGGAGFIAYAAYHVLRPSFGSWVRRRQARSAETVEPEPQRG